MPDSIPERIGDSLSIIWTIAAKDITDALKNKIVVSMIIMLSVILIMPKMLPLIFEQPQTVVPIFDLGASSSVTAFENDPTLAVQILHSELEFRNAICGAIYPLIGLRITADFDQTVAAGGAVEIQGYACWSKRHQVAEVLPKLEVLLSQSIDRPVTIQIEGNIVFPPEETVLLLSIATINSVLMILMMGIFLVPSLLLEEKESRTMQALLVSPASIGQVVVGKTLAGLFYILVTGGMIFAISWAEVVHWDMVFLFVLGGGFFSVAVGLILGSFYDKQQDIVGWMSALLILLVGAIFVEMLGIELPALVEQILPWVPSVALAEICRAAFAENVPVSQVMKDLGIILLVSLPLYAVVVWKVRRSDR